MDFDLSFLCLAEKKRGEKNSRDDHTCPDVGIYLVLFCLGIELFPFPFYERTGIAKAAFSAEKFQDFLTGYVGKLNESYSKAGDTLSGWYLERYTTAGPMSKIPVAGVIQEGYGKMASRFGLVEPGKFFNGKADVVESVDVPGGCDRIYGAFLY